MSGNVGTIDGHKTEHTYNVGSYVSSKYVLSNNLIHIDLSTKKDLCRNLPGAITPTIEGSNSIGIKYSNIRIYT